MNSTREIKLIPIASPKLPPIWDINEITDISFFVAYFKISSCPKKILMIPISLSKISRLWSLGNLMSIFLLNRKYHTFYMWGFSRYLDYDNGLAIVSNCNEIRIKNTIANFNFDVDLNWSFEHKNLWTMHWNLVVANRSWLLFVHWLSNC